MCAYTNEQWNNIFKDAVEEFEHVRLTCSIASRRKAISVRLEKLYNAPGMHAEERTAITDVLRILHLVEVEDAHYQREEKQQLLDEALNKLTSVAPAISRLAA